MVEELNAYGAIIQAIFFKYYREGEDRIAFTRQDIVEAARELGISRPRNLGDVIYSFRYRRELPPRIKALAPTGQEFVILSTGRSEYAFVLTKASRVTPNVDLVETKILDATPGIITKYALDDEQSLLAKLRYNRLIDIFTGLTCYSLQNHLRTTVPGIGQTETDEIYIGIDRRGAHYVLPVQAKGGTDKLGAVQIQQDFAVCKSKFPELICIPIAAQFMSNDIIALFAFERDEEGDPAISLEKHYRLVRAEELSIEELRRYKQRLD